MSYPQYDPNQQQPGGYQQPYPYQYGQPYGPPQDHPQATMALILGILGLALCGVLAPFAWVIGKRAVREIDASGGAMGGRGSAQAGYILGLVGSILLILGLVFLVIYIVIIVAVLGASSNG